MKRILLVLALIFCGFTTAFAQGSVPPLLDQLTSPDSSVRAQAAKRCSEEPEAYLQDQRVRDALLAAASDKNPFVRVNAITALGLTADPRALAPCLAGLKDEFVQVQYAAVTALGRLGAPEALSALLALAEDAVSPLRRKALTVLADPLRPAEPAIVTALISARLFTVGKAALAETDTESRVAGVRLLGKAVRQEALREQCLNVLLVAGKDPDPAIRKATVQALAGCRNRRCTDIFLAAFRDTDDEVMYAGNWGMSQLLKDNPDAQRAVKPAMIDLLQHGDTRVVIQVCNILRELKDPDYTPALLTALQRNPQALGWSAIESITVSGPAAYNQVLEAARRQDPKLRAAAAYLLSHARELPQPVELMDQLLRDPEAAVRKAAITGELKPDPHYTDTLIVLLHDPDAEVRQAAILRLRFPAKRALIEPLKTCLHDPTPEVRGAAVISLGWFPTADMIDAVLPCLRDADATVRESALWAVKQYTDPRIGPALLPLLADPEMRVRRTAISTALRQPGTYPALLEAVRVEPVADTRREMIEMLGWDRDVRALPLLIDISQHDKELAVRRAATWALGCLHETAAYEPLLAALQAPEDGVKDAAKSALATLGDRRVVEVFCTILASGKDSWVTEPLQTMNDPRIVTLVEPLFESKYPHVRDQALRILLAKGHPRAVELFTARWQAAKTLPAKKELVGRYLNEGRIRPLPPTLLPICLEVISMEIYPYANYKTFFASGLGDNGVREVIPYLLKMLEDKSEHTQAPELAARALGNLKAKEAVDGILPLLMAPEANTRRAAAEALGKIGDPRVVDTLDATARTETDTTTRVFALGALCRLGDPRGMDGLLAAMRDPALRQRAVWTLGQVNDPRAREALATVLEDEDTGIRNAAAMGLLRQGDRRGALPCLALQRTASISSEDDDTFLNLFVALHDPATVPPLLTTAREGTLPARIFALRALGGLQAKEGVPLLVQALGDEFTLIREAAAKGLGACGAPEAAPALIAALADPSSKVREAAVASLGQLKVRTAIKPLQALLQTEESPRVRDAAEAAVGMITGK
jgi:HEAT repeat protein